MSMFEAIAAWAAGGMGAGGGFFAFKWLVEYIGGRMDKRAAALDAGTQALIEHLQAQVSSLTDRIGSVTARLDHVEKELDECRAQHAEARGKLAQMEGVMQGLGDARGVAQMIVAADRLSDRKENEGGQ